MSGDEGADQLDGGAWNDILGGDAGADLLVGLTGDDQLLGNAEGDTLSGGDGDDLLIGGGDQDSLEGGSGDDTLMGGASNFDLTTTGTTDWSAEMLDAYRSLEVSNPVLASTGTAVDIFASAEFAGVDTSGASTPVVDMARDFLSGGDGNDVIFLESGDVGQGGAGNDAFHLNGDATPASLMTIRDFDAADDAIVIEYDGALAPVVTVADNGANAEVSLNGALVAIFESAAGTVIVGDINVVTVDRAVP
jgi:Ca2+-binding RTX toxin-like protein